MFEQLFQVFLSEWKSVGGVQTKTTLSPIDIHCVDKTHTFSWTTLGWVNDEIWNGENEKVLTST